MEIHVTNNRLRASLADEATRTRRYGHAMSKKLSLRLTALRAAKSLADFWPPNSGPERCHELKADFAGVFSIDLKNPYRLLFRPVEPNQPDDRSDEQQRWKSITAVNIVAIEDTHG
jgi:proteic killer suppression protein